MTSLLTSCYIRHVCWHYKSVYSLIINFYEWVKYPTTTNCAKDQCPPSSPDLTQPTRLPCVVCGASSISQTSVKAKDHPRAKKCTAADLGWLARDNDQQSCRLSPFANVWTRAFRAMDGGHFEHMIWTGWSRVIWHNFITVAGNWIKIGSLAYIGTHNRCVKFGLKIHNRLGKNGRKSQGGIFWLTL